MMTAGRPCLDRHQRIMGAPVRFRSDSAALLDLVDAAYDGHAPHRFPQEGPLLDVELRLLPPGAATSRGAPPAVRTRLGEGLAYGVMDARNHVAVAPRARRARIVASADMLDHPYHLRYELLEFAVFLLAARCQGLVPLHAGCVGRDGRGILLLGASGAGKSTLAVNSLLQGLEFLSEDAVFVEPVEMLATGVANFLHVRTDGLDGIGDIAARRWIAGSPVIQRRSGVAKYEADLRCAPAPAMLAPQPMRLVGAVILSQAMATGVDASLVPATAAEVADCLADDEQAYARSQPGWSRFERWAMGAPVLRLLRGRHPRSSVDAIQRLLG